MSGGEARSDEVIALADVNVRGSTVEDHFLAAPSSVTAPLARPFQTERGHPLPQHFLLVFLFCFLEESRSSFVIQFRRYPHRNISIRPVQHRPFLLIAATVLRARRCTF